MIQNILLVSVFLTFASSAIAQIAEEEKALRKNPLGAAGSLAKKVFGAL